LTGLSQIDRAHAEEVSEIDGPRNIVTLNNVTQKGKAMPDGSRKRRHSANRVKQQWYAQHRALRFSRRLLGTSVA